MPAVGLVGGDHQLAATTHPHALHAIVPALDDLTEAQPEGQRLATVVGRVELLAGVKSDADVVDQDAGAASRLGAITHNLVDDQQLGRGRSLWDFDEGLLAHSTRLPEPRQVNGS